MDPYVCNVCGGQIDRKGFCEVCGTPAGSAYVQDDELGQRPSPRDIASQRTKEKDLALTQ
jgi:predicted amidophosphoribosyltransferase